MVYIIGDACDTTYPGVPQSAMTAFWEQVTTVFDGLLFNSETDKLNTSTIASLVASNHRVIIYVSPFNFTGNSTNALDGCTIDNELGGDLAQLQTAAATRAADKANDSLFLMSFAGGGPDIQLVYAFLIETFPELTPDITPLCLKALGAVNQTQCPLHLMDMSLQANYFNQPVFDASVSAPGYDMPGAIYMDGIDVNGTMRTGSDLFGPFYGGIGGPGAGPTNGTARYAYVDTMLLATVRRLCGLTGADGYGKGAGLVDDATLTALCPAYVAVLEAQRALYPTQEWVDTVTGRTLFPPANTTMWPDRQWRP